jgi:hypothetical protein
MLEERDKPQCCRRGISLNAALRIFSVLHDFRKYIPALAN